MIPRLVSGQRGPASACADRLRPVTGPITQSIRLRWRPELRFYEQRIRILRDLETAGLLQGFRVSEETVDAQLPGWRWLTVWQSGLTLDVLSDTVDTQASWQTIQDAIELIAPLQYSHARVSYQHVAPLSATFEEAVSLSYEHLYRNLSTDEVAVGDWALLADIATPASPAATGKVELGIVRRDELPLRLNRLGGRSPGMQHIGQRDWQPGEFKAISLFADSDLVCQAPAGQEEAFLEEACAFWDASRSRMSKLVEDWSSKLAAKDDGGA